MSVIRFLAQGQVSQPLTVAPQLSLADGAFWPKANKRIIWGWKRDSQSHSRTVYFSGELARGEHGIDVTKSFFFYKHRTNVGAVERHLNAYDQADRLLAEHGMKMRTLVHATEVLGMQTLYATFGKPSDVDVDRVRRLVQRRARTALRPAVIPHPRTDLGALITRLPMDLFVGSGLSYEAGIPTLCQVHDYFCVDNHANNSFTYGEADQLPQWLASDPVAAITEFCRVYTQALTAQPTNAQRVIGELYRQGLVRTIFTDNVDNLLCKVGVPFTRTRGSGVFNERCNVEFGARTLVVVGVAADRRQIITQARARRMTIVDVDPCMRVSHGVQHLNFMKPDDLFYKCTANEFFTALERELGLRKAIKEEEEAAIAVA
jgi:hypothetical protein